MACRSCQAAREGARTVVKALIRGDAREAVNGTREAAHALGEKLEALRVRALTRGR